MTRTRPTSVPMLTLALWAALIAGCASTRTTFGPAVPAAPVAHTAGTVPPRGTPTPVPAGPFSIAARRADGSVAGSLVLGETTFDGAKRVLPPASGEGAPAAPEGYPQVRVGAVAPAPTLAYTAANAPYELYFDAARRLVLVQDHRTDLAGLSTDELAKRYPQLRETERDVDAVEMQGEIAPCVALLVLVGQPGAKVEDAAYAYTCRTRP